VFVILCGGQYGQPSDIDTKEYKWPKGFMVRFVFGSGAHKVMLSPRGPLGCLPVSHETRKYELW